MSGDGGGKPEQGETKPNEAKPEEQPQAATIPPPSAPNGGVEPEQPEKNSWNYDRTLAAANIVVLFLTFLAAGYAGCEADRLANDTEAGIEHADRIANSNADQTANLYAAWGMFAAAMNRQAASTDKLVDQAGRSAASAAAGAIAQGRLARLAEAATVPPLEATALTLSGLKSTPSAMANGKVLVRAVWQFTNMGTSPIRVKTMSLELHNGINIEPRPKYASSWPVYVNIEPGRNIEPAVDSFFPLRPDDAAAIASGKQIAVVYGYMIFLDTLKREHRWCFGYQMQTKDNGDATTGFFAVMNPAYWCST